jgi:hypothetical protein
MRTLHKSLFALAVVLLPFFSVAEKPPIKLGDITKEELKMTQYDPDPNAEAVVLCDYGYRNWIFDTNGSGWRHELKRICRIKIFHKDGYDWATESISLYHSGRLEESVSQIKGFTYNLVDGKVEKTKLGKENIFDEEASEKVRRVKFTLPNVQEGSVIEFQYTVSSNYHTIIEPWFFQHSIPVVWSEYIVEVPEYFRYIPSATGFETFHVHENGQSSGSINWVSTSREGFTVTRSTMSSHKIDYVEYITRFVAKDVPALKDEVFVGNSDNYLQSMGYQLATFRGFDDKLQTIVGNWPDIIDQFVKDEENFGPNMRARSFYKDITRPILEKYQTPAERIAAVYSFVSNYMKWNERFGFIPSDNIKKSFDDRTGSAADINGLLVSMLRAVEINADPVILSTVSNGLVHPVYPLLDKYNYLIARAKIGDESILLDATEKEMPIGLLPTRCLNQRGYAISNENPGWVDLRPLKGYDKTVMCMLSIDENGLMSGTLDCKYDGYTGLNIRKKLRLDGEEKYIENFTSNHTEWAIREMKIEDPESVDDPVKESIRLEISDKAEALGEMIYINPMLTDRIDENPFKQEKRKLPIEFIIPIKNSYMLNLQIPEGYVVEELPEQVSVTTSDRSAHLKYLVQAVGDRLQVMHSWGVDNTFYNPDAYQELKEFYALLVAKQNEQIVLKKVQPIK